MSVKKILPGSYKFVVDGFCTATEQFGNSRRLDDKVLQLAIQPDSWGERTRARLMSELAPALRLPSDGGSTLSTEEIVQVTNAVVPCFLLELGRRKQHIQVEFPLNPATRTPRRALP